MEFEWDANQRQRNLRNHGIDFEDGKEITWTVPDGWKQQPGSASRFATILVGLEDKPMELTVVPLGREAGSPFGIEGVGPPGHLACVGGDHWVFRYDARLT